MLFRLRIGNTDTCERLHFDQSLFSPRRVLLALLQYGWWSEEDREVADRVGLWAFLKYGGRPYHECMETGKFCG